MKTRYRLATLFIALICSVIFVTPTQAAADIVIKIGYAGGPYYEKHYFSDAEMTAMSGLHEYSNFDKGNFLRKGFGYGIDLDSLFDKAGIDPYMVWRFFFNTRDGYLADNGEDGYAAWSKGELTKTRYYYPALIEHYDFKKKDVFNDRVAEIKASQITVPTILASSSSYERVHSRDDPRWFSSSFMSSGNRYRLLFGQTAYNAGDARFNAHSIQEILCILGDKPTIMIEEGDIEGEIGDEFDIDLTLLADDELVAKEGVKDIAVDWLTVDPNVAEITKNANGSLHVKIVGEGATNINLSYGRSSDAQYVARASIGVNKIGEDITEEFPGSNPDDPDGTGLGSGTEGEGAGSGDGTDDWDSNTSRLELTADSAESLDEAPTPLAGDSANAESGVSGALGSGSGLWQLELAAIEEESAPLQLLVFDEHPAWTYGIGLGGLLLLGGLYRVGNYELSRDHYRPRPRKPCLHYEMPRVG
jgi:hypothetical protein